MSIRRSVFAMLAAIAGTLVLPVSGAQAMEKDKAVIAALPFFSTAPVFIAKERGYFDARSEEHTSELQSLMRISYAVFCLKKKKQATCRTYKVKYVPSD